MKRTHITNLFICFPFVKNYYCHYYKNWKQRENNLKFIPFIIIIFVSYSSFNRMNNARQLNKSPWLINANHWKNSILIFKQNHLAATFKIYGTCLVHSKTARIFEFVLAFSTQFYIACLLTMHSDQQHKGFSTLLNFKWSHFTQHCKLIGLSQHHLHSLPITHSLIL